MAQPTQSSINFPQLIAVALVGFFAVRWYFSKPTTPSTPSISSDSRTPQIDLTKINQISSMFPQSDRREIAWDLHRNGGNVSATTERILGGRTLDTPPHSFQPVLDPPASNTSSTTTGTTTVGTGASTGTSLSSTQQNLIERYNLQSKINSKGKEPLVEESTTNSWSADKTARAANLKRRREEMILAARRKLESTEAARPSWEGDGDR